MKILPFPLIAALVIFCSMAGCLPYRFDTVHFAPAGPVTPTAAAAPKTYIDTNVSIPGPFGGSVKSRKPYSIGIDHVDLTFTFATLEFTKVVVTYHDGTGDPGAAALKLPLRMDFRHHVSINSGGPPPKYTRETPMRLASGRIPNVITRDEPFTLLIEGRFIKDNGSIVPFRIREGYKPEIDKSTKSWAEVISDI